jgi:hypothetical protein
MGRPAGDHGAHHGDDRHRRAGADADGDRAVGGVRHARRNAAAGGLAAIVVFIVVSFWSARNLATPEADQATALFGNFAIGLSGYAGVALIVLLVGVLTAATSHMTVVAYLTDIETRQTD